MKPHVKTKILIVSLFLFLLFAVSYRFQVFAPRLLSSGSGFNLFYEDSALTFQHYSHVEFDCITGAWNATNGTYSLWLDRGSFSFIPVDNCTLNIGTSSDRILDLKSVRAALTSSEGNYTATVLNGSLVTFTWRFKPWSMIDNYFMLGVGLTGIIMLVAGPTMFAMKAIKHGLDDTTIEWLGYAMLFVIMGFGFLVVWLWQ